MSVRFSIHRTGTSIETRLFCIQGSGIVCLGTLARASNEPAFFGFTASYTLNMRGYFSTLAICPGGSAGKLR